MKQNISGKELVNTLTERVTLNIFRAGCERTNFFILKSLPSNLRDLQEKFQLSKMPMNRRINELEQVGLVKRDRYTGKVEPTELTKVFINMIEELKDEVVKEIPNLI